MTLAAGWYIAAASSEWRGRTPRKVDLFGQELVGWRDGAGRPSLLSRHCPHLGASLAEGKVVNGELRCPFHHWSFGADGTCLNVPGMTHHPRIDGPRVYPTEERHGFVWAWYGGAEPVYPLPEMPALDSAHDYLTYRFRRTTPASPRRVLENAYDHYHFMSLHGVRSAHEMSATILTDPAETAENGPPFLAEAWTGVRLEADGLEVPRIAEVLGVHPRRFVLLVDGWPGGQRLTFLLDGQVLAKELLGVTPVSTDHTVVRGWSLVRRSGNRLRDAVVYGVYRGQHWWGTREDFAIYRNAVDEGGVPVRHDAALLRYRKHYASWVRRADDRLAETS